MPFRRRLTNREFGQFVYRVYTGHFAISGKLTVSVVVLEYSHAAT